MTAKKTTRARKKKTAKNDPVRARRRARTRVGQEIVDAILDAAGLILAKDGYAGMTTNHLAQRAGVSIGSLYHYFPNKESVITALAERVERTAIAVLDKRRRELPEGSKDRDIVRSLGTSLIAEELGSRETRRALLLEVPRRWIEGAAKARHAFVGDQLTSVIQERANLGADEADLMTFVMKSAVEGVIESTLVHRPELFETPELAEQVTRLIGRYLATEP